MISNWCLLCSDKLTKEEEDIHRLRHDLRKTSISNQPCRQAAEVSHYHSPPHYSSFLPEHKDTLVMLSVTDLFPPCSLLRTANHQFHLLGSQLSLPRMAATSSRSVTPSAWLSEARWAAAAAAANVCFACAFYVMPSIFCTVICWEPVFFAS